MFTGFSNDDSTCAPRSRKLPSQFIRKLSAALKTVRVSKGGFDPSWARFGRRRHHWFASHDRTSTRAFRRRTGDGHRTDALQVPASAAPPRGAAESVLSVRERPTASRPKAGNRELAQPLQSPAVVASGRSTATAGPRAKRPAPTAPGAEQISK